MASRNLHQVAGVRQTRTRKLIEWRYRQDAQFAIRQLQLFPWFSQILFRRTTGNECFAG